MVNLTVSAQHYAGKFRIPNQWCQLAIGKRTVYNIILLFVKVKQSFVSQPAPTSALPVCKIEGQWLLTETLNSRCWVIRASLYEWVLGISLLLYAQKAAIILPQTWMNEICMCMCVYVCVCTCMRVYVRVRVNNLTHSQQAKIVVWPNNPYSRFSAEIILLQRRTAYDHREKSRPSAEHFLCKINTASVTVAPPVTGRQDQLLTVSQAWFPYSWCTGCGSAALAQLYGTRALLIIKDMQSEKWINEEVSRSECRCVMYWCTRNDSWCTHVQWYTKRIHNRWCQYVAWSGCLPGESDRGYDEKTE